MITHELERILSDEKILESFGICLQTEDEKDKAEKIFNGTIKGNEFSCAVFSSTAMINMIGENIPRAMRHYFVDGTFNIGSIGPFVQLLNIHVGHLNSVRII